MVDRENLTATCGADTLLSEIDAELRPLGLFWPGGRVLQAEGPSLKAHLDAGAAGPWRLGWGATRDWVLGLKVRNPRGEVVKFGGAMVKNVAGLNLTRVLVGAGGALGEILEATLRLAPLPEASVTLAAEFGGARDGLGDGAIAALAALPGLLGSKLNPSALDFVSPGTLLVTLEGTAADLPRRTAEASAALAAAGGRVAAPAEGPAEADLWAWRAGQPSGWGREWGSTVRIRCGVPARRGADLIRAAQAALAGHRCAATAHVGNGLWQLYVAAGDPGPLAAALHAVRTAAEQSGGYLLIEDGPPQLAERIPFRMPHPADALEVAIRQAFADAEPVGGGAGAP